MRSITLRPGESLKIGDTMIYAEYSDFKSEYSQGAATELFPLKRKNPGGPQGPEELLDFLNAQSVEDQRAFAVRCGTSVGYLRLIAYKARRCGESLAINIDRESGGEVSLEELRPDVDWEHVRQRTPKGDLSHA